MQTVFHVLILFFALLFFSACSTKSSLGWERTKTAAYNAAVDPMTWAPLATGVALDVTGYDDVITNTIIDDEKVLFTEAEANDFRDLTAIIAYSTALAVPDDNFALKRKRVFVEAFALATGRVSVTVMNNLIDKEYPRPILGENDAIGSQHAVGPFLASALTARNLEKIDYVPDWSKYAIATISYAAATGSTYQRIQGGLHSVSDQLYSVMVGNFLALFIHDSFMADGLSLSIQLSPKESMFVLNMPL